MATSFQVNFYLIEIWPLLAGIVISSFHHNAPIAQEDNLCTHER
ncbi:MAG: hypothetical protein EZS28_041593, partial [Streblomastix strix]